MFLSSSDREEKVKVKVLLDTGATEYDYISERLVRKLALKTEAAEPGLRICPVNRECSVVSCRTLITLIVSNSITNSDFFFTINPAVTSELAEEDFDLIVVSRR